MKLFLVVLLAGVWSATAAPHTNTDVTLNFSFQEYGLDVPMFENFRQVGEVLKCIQTAIDRVVEESDLGPVWDETKANIDGSLSNDWPMCASITDKYYKLKCQATVAHNVVYFVNVFVTELSKVNELKLAQEIKKKVLTFCFKSQGGLIEVENEIVQTPVPNTFLARFECLAKALDKVSKALGLQSLWEKSQPQLGHHLGKWKQCQQVENAVFRYFCEAKEVATSFVIVTEYVKLAAAQEPNFNAAFKTYYKEHCTGKSFADELTEVFAVEEVAANPIFFERFVCVAKSLDTVSKAHGLQSLWEKTQPELEHHLGKWKKCLTSSNPVYVAVCQAKAGVESFICITKYIKLAAAQDPTFTDDFAADYKKNCAGHSYSDELAETFVVDGLKACVEKLVQKVKCVTEAVTESVHETDFESVWAEARSALTHLQKKLVQCTSSDEADKCIFETLKEGYSLFAKFLKHLKAANYDAYNEIKENVQKKCFTQ